MSTSGAIYPTSLRKYRLFKYINITKNASNILISFSSILTKRPETVKILSEMIAKSITLHFRWRMLKPRCFDCLQKMKRFNKVMIPCEDKHILWRKNFSMVSLFCDTILNMSSSEFLEALWLSLAISARWMPSVTVKRWMI